MVGVAAEVLGIVAHCFAEFLGVVHFLAAETEWFIVYLPRVMISA